MGMDYYLNPPPPVPAGEQVFRKLQSRAAELRHYLAVDHEAARKRAQAELERIEEAMRVLREVESEARRVTDPSPGVTDVELLDAVVREWKKTP